MGRTGTGRKRQQEGCQGSYGGGAGGVQPQSEEAAEDYQQEESSREVHSAARAGAVSDADGVPHRLDKPVVRQASAVHDRRLYENGERQDNRVLWG